MNIWIHRISHHAEVAYPLLDKGYVSIGFSEFSDTEFIKEICSENGWGIFEEYFNDIWAARPKTRYSLWRFINEMREGDLIVVPSWGTFSIFEIVLDRPKLVSEIELSEMKDWHGNLIEKKEDGFLYSSKGERIDLGFVRKVKPIQKDIPRYEYADAALTSRLKIRSTNANITDLRASIEKAIEGFLKKQPLNIYSQIISKSQQGILSLIREELTPDKFENLVKWYFKRIGASEVFIPAKNESGKEGDADVIAVFEPLKTIIYSQVKFHTGETSSWAIEQIKNYKDYQDSMDDGYSKNSWVISSASNFSQESYDLAKEARVHLIDGNQFTKMLLEAGIENLEKAL